MIMETFGWLCTVLVLIGFVLNSLQKLKYAIYLWIIGDLGWIIYDLSINNYSHLVLSFIIILINLYGLFKLRK